mgnify:CR=1 FL=1|jgi:hypothetical protein
MWKVVVVICALYNPCTVMHQDPPKFYQNKADCMIVADSKHTELLKAYAEYNYLVTSSQYSCILDNRGA